MRRTAQPSGSSFSCPCWARAPTVRCRFSHLKGKTEQHLRAGSVTFTIISPTAFMEVWISLVSEVTASRIADPTMLKPDQIDEVDPSSCESD